jgi:hypothetical protein
MRVLEPFIPQFLLKVAEGFIAIFRDSMNRTQTDQHKTAIALKKLADLANAEVRWAGLEYDGSELQDMLGAFIVEVSFEEPEIDIGSAFNTARQRLVEFMRANTQYGQML